MKRWSRQLGWQWVLLGALLIMGRFTVVWAGSVSPSIEDTGTNVGIGTTVPVGKLDVQGGRSYFAASSEQYGVGVKYVSSGGAVYFGATSNSVTPNAAISNAGGGTLMTLQNGGNVGIGTTVPVGKLDVQGGRSYFAASSEQYGVGVRYVPSGGAVYFGATSNSVTPDAAISNAGGGTLMTLQNGGNVGIGTTSPTTKLHVAGDVQVDGNLAAKYQDVAEWVPAPSSLPPGTVVVVDPQQYNQVLPASQSYDTRVAGVVSSRPGLLLGEAGEGKVKVAQSGRVPVKVDASYGQIAVGDLLVTSPTLGHAMRSTPLNLGGTLLHRPGTLLGKALERLEEGRGEILVLLTLQ